MDTQSLQNILLFLSLTPLVLLAVIFALFLDRKNLKSQIVKLNEKINSESKSTDFYIGAKALLEDYGLTYTSNTTGDKKDFRVDYEIEIVDISENNIKVRAIDFKGHDSLTRDPAMRSGILGYLQDRWIPKESAEIILDDSHNRHVKLEQLGI